MSATSNKTSNKTNALFLAAKKVMKNAHAPYSNFHVGAALLDSNGKIHVGCNVENASYGATICAERNAIAAMLASGGKHFTEIVVVTQLTRGTPPCGMCRQVMGEFAKTPNKVMIHIGSPNTGILKTFTVDSLLPEAFGPAYLTKL